MLAGLKPAPLEKGSLRMPDNLVGLIVLLIGLAILLALLTSVVHIIREYERLVVFFFGRLQGGRGPGLVLSPVRPAGGQGRPRERFSGAAADLHHKDNAPISIDFLVYSKVFDPLRR
jgi:regulator of protease activity HflC (stomatin/prohibitin superfamily)